MAPSQSGALEGVTSQVTPSLSNETLSKMRTAASAISDEALDDAEACRLAFDSRGMKRPGRVYEPAPVAFAPV